MSSFYLEISKSYIKLLLGTTYEETKRSLNTEFALEGHVEGGGRSLLGNRGEGGSRAGKEGSDGELHFDDVGVQKILRSKYDRFERDNRTKRSRTGFVPLFALLKPLYVAIRLTRTYYTSST